MAELQVKVQNQLGSIEFNFEELKDNLTNMMSAYEGAEFTEESSNIAKKESAALKKIKKALSDRRIEIKKEYMKPYDDFEVRVKELTALIDKPIELIDTQVKAFDEKKKAEKKEKIQELYSELIGELEEYLPLSKIYDSKWENISTTMKSIQEEIETVISSTEMAISTIKGMNSEVVEKALEQFKGDLSLANAIAYINKREQMKAEILAQEEAKRKEELERARQAEIEKIRQEERQRIAEEERIRAEERKKTEEKLLAVKESVEEIQPLPFDDSEVGQPFLINEVRAVFTVMATREELAQVEMYMNSIGIEYERSDE